MPTYDYEWDDIKRDSNLRKHGLDFVDVWQILEADHVREDARPGSDGEPRLKATGTIGAVCATVIFTLRDDVIRIISLRRARQQERRALDAALQQRTASPDVGGGQKPH